DRRAGARRSGGQGGVLFRGRRHSHVRHGDPHRQEAGPLGGVRRIQRLALQCGLPRHAADLRRGQRPFDAGRGLRRLGAGDGYPRRGDSRSGRADVHAGARVVCRRRTGAARSQDRPRHSGAWRRPRGGTAAHVDAVGGQSGRCPMNAWVAGVGAWYPDDVRRNADWPPEFGRTSLGGDRLFNDIPRAADAASRITDEYLQAEVGDPFLGVRERRVCPPSISAVDAEVWAAERALADAGVRAEDVDVLLSYSVVPERLTPATGCAVAHRLCASRGLDFGMDAACATALVQRDEAASFIRTGRADTVLLSQSHLILRTYPMALPAAPELGDAATALVVRPT